MKKLFASALALILIAIPSAAQAATTQFTQTISSGTLGVSVLDNSEATVPSPTVGMAGVGTSALCNTTGATGTLGTATQRLYVNNPGAANNGWTLAIAATNGATATWSDGTHTYDFNDPTGSGCNDGADADSIPGQMTVNASGSSLTLACSSTCSTTGVSLGSGQAFSQGTVDAISLITAGSNSDDIWRGYLTNIGITQTVPAAQSPGSYNIDMTLTVTAS